LWDELIPQVEQEVGIGAAEPIDEMVFECVNDTFGCITAVNVRGGQGKLIGDILLVKVLLEGGRGFIV
jgi:hypothetical protein